MRGRNSGRGGGKPAHGSAKPARGATSKPSRPGAKPTHAPTHATRGAKSSRPQPGRPGNSAERGRQRAAEARSEGRSSSSDRWVVGIHSAAEALRVRPTKVREFWLRDDYESAHQLRELAAQAEAQGITIRPRTLGQLDSIGSGHQGVAIAVCESPELNWADLKEPGSKVILILDGIEDPHNLGSMLRTAWLTGVTGVLIPEDRAVGLTPSVCKVASGGAEHVPVESFTSLPSAIQDLKEAGFWVYGLSEKGTGKPWDFKLPEKVAWIVGSEGGGMRITTERSCDELVKIPQVTTGSSYNAAIAMAMALSETCRQFGKPE